MIKSVKLEDLKELLTEKGFTIFGHGTGGSNKDVISPIFVEGLRASHTSIFYTTVGLDVDEALTHFKEKLNHWEHLDSENIILIKLPNQYFNLYGDSMDLDCERTGAFVNQKLDNTGKITYYLDPKFIIGAYNRDTERITLNPNYETKLSAETLLDLEQKFEKTIAKTKSKKLAFEENLLAPFTQNNEGKSHDKSFVSFDMNSSIDDLNWEDDFLPPDESRHKSR